MPRPTLEKLKPHHRMAASLKLTGLTHAQIAASLNTSKAVVDRWMRDPLLKDEVERQVELAQQDLRQQLLAGAKVALDVLTRRIQAPAMERAITDDDGKIVGYEPVSLEEAPITDHHRSEMSTRLLDMTEGTRISDDGAGADGQGGGVWALIAELNPDQLKALGAAAQERQNQKLIEGKGQLKE